MNYERFNFIRERLVELYPLITEYTFEIVAPASTFLELKQLQGLDKTEYRPGTERVGIPVVRPLTITQLTKALTLNGNDAELYFRWPSRDIIRIYEGIQEYIKLWLEIKVDWGWFESARLEELEELEAVAKFVFTPYKEYHAAKVAKEFGYQSTGDMSLVNSMRSLWMFGNTVTEDISFVSHIAMYKEGQGLTQQTQSSYGRSETLEELLNSGFGAGLQGLV